MPPSCVSGLSRVAAVPLAFGSIAGSGILSLPSAVYAESGSASLTVWLIAGAMCVPMLLMFRDAMALSGDGDAVQTLVTRGLRPWAGSAMPLMFFFVVVIGLPTGCVIAGRYVERGLHWPGVAPIVAIALLAVALAANLLGGTVGKGMQLVGSAVLVATGVFLIASGLSHPTHTVSVIPSGPSWGHVLPGALLAFWAFVGFENLTFLGRDLRNPTRDFLPVSIAALAINGTFAIALTLTIAATVEQHSVDAVTGLLQLATNRSVQAGVAMVALAAMLINAAAWVRGVDRLIATAAHDRQVPERLAQAPALRAVLLAMMFAVTLTVLTAMPNLTVDALAGSSAVFVLIYLTCTTAYILLSGLTVRTSLNALLIPVMAITLIESGARSLYGLIVAAACLIWSYLRRKHAPTKH